MLAQSHHAPPFPLELPMCNRSSLFVCWLILSVFANLDCICQLSSATQPDGPSQPVFQAGAATIDITPTTERSIVAGGFLEGQATQINDRLYVRCILLDDGVTKIALTVVDTCMMTQSLIDEAKRLANQQCGIPVDKMMVSATHTHSAPAAMACLGTRLDKDYADWLPAKIAEAIVAAHHQLAPARIGWNSIDDWQHTHNRRWIRKPENKIADPFGQATGLAHMHPGYLSTEVIGPSGPVDPELSLISVQNLEGKPIAVFANYSQHYFGAQAISSDYYGLFCKHVAELLDEPGEGNGPFVCAMSQGTSGDLMWMDYGSPAKSISMAEYAESVARNAEKALSTMSYRDHVPLAMSERTLRLNYRVPNADRLEWARPIASTIENNLAKSVQEVYAKEALILHDRQSTELKLQVIQIGELTIATLPNEVYALTGLKLKGRSPSPWHFNIELANGSEGYIPPPEQHTLGGYTTWPARTAGLEVDAEPKIVDTLLDALEQTTQRKRRIMDDQHGAYANAILQAGPISYWRLNDADGTVARNAVTGGEPAQLTPGFAWYLPGVGSGSGIGLREELTTSPFSGPNQINRAVHIAGGELQGSFAPKDGDYSIVFWFWLGERSGAEERSGTLCVSPYGDTLIAKQSIDHQVRLELNGVATEMEWPADDWHQVWIVHQKGNAAVYVDESVTPVIQTKANSLVCTQQVRLGKGLQGKLDELAVFDRALTEVERDSLWSKSEVAEERQRAALHRQRVSDAAHVQQKSPTFADDYETSIKRLQPIVFESLISTPKDMTVQGNVSFSKESFANFQTGRIELNCPEIQDTYSVSLWFRNQLSNDSRPVTAYLFSRGPNGDQQAPGDHIGIGGTYNSQQLGKVIAFNGNARDQIAACSSTIPAQTWNHLVAVRSKNQVRIFINGEPKPEVEAELDDTTQGNTEFFLGARSDQFAPLQGQLAFFALFDRALTNEEAKALHSASGQPAGTFKAPAIPLANPASKPLSPGKSLAKIHVPAGFRVELVASEPQVIDPVAFDWDAAGKLWVVEMSDYPMGMDGQGKPGGRVRVLEDKDGDGRYEHSTLFADELNFPNGIITWRDGVIVTAAPQILFLSDSDGDGKADKREVLFEGFNQGNQQLRMNGLRWGLDNWIYCANGGHHANHGLGTKVLSHRNQQLYEIGSRDFRFQPDSGALIVESGPSQFGRNRDAWGHWFGTQNAKPLWNYVIADRYLARNPFVPSASPIQFVLPPNSPPVYPASRAEKRFHSFGESGHFTSACGGMIYGDQKLLGASDRLHAFTCEPFHNLVQHNIVSDVGVSFTSTRPIGEGNYDFFASEDRWCRPVMARTGPDGALWIADMYRYMIEHPDWLPPEGKQELLPHYRLGDDRGRIYRIVPTTELPSKVHAHWFPTDSIESIVNALDSTNDWQRDKAQQLLININDKNAVPFLERLVRSSGRAETRLQALATLDGLGSLKNPLIKLALHDPHPRVRENAIRMIESSTDIEIQTEALQLVSDPDDKVCLQLALTLGEWSSIQAGTALIKLAQRYYEEPFVRSAVMSSALTHASVFAEGISKSSPEVASAFRESIVRQSIGRKDYEALNVLLSNALTDVPDAGPGALDELLLTLQRAGSSLNELAEADETGALVAPMKRLELFLQQTVKEVDLSTMDASERIDAARLLCRTQEYRSVGIESLSQWLTPQIAPEMQHRVLETYSQCGDDRVTEVLAMAWPSLSPELRIRALDVWLSRTAWANDLLNRIEQGLVKAGSLELGQRDRLLRYPDAAIAGRSQRLLLGSQASTRKEIVDHYRQALKLQSEVGRGKTVYTRACASCHRRENDGHEVGPNLATVTNHTSEKLLINILDPNADIQPGYQAYSVLLEDGEVLSGLLAGETANSITIKLVNGSTRTISRLEIEQLRNSNVSFMPEGLEATLTQQDLSDLIAFLQSPVVDGKP